jgi:hydroxyacylglutathione hydrolase
VTIDDRRILLAGDTLWGGWHPETSDTPQRWRASLERLATVELDAMTFGHGVTHLVDRPRERIREAVRRFGVYFDPWFRPPGETFLF